MKKVILSMLFLVSGQLAWSNEIRPIQGKKVVMVSVKATQELDSLYQNPLLDAKKRAIAIRSLLTKEAVDFCETATVAHQGPGNTKAEILQVCNAVLLSPDTIEELAAEPLPYSDTEGLRILVSQFLHMGISFGLN